MVGKAQSIFAVAGKYGTGSAAEILWESADALTAAKFRVRAARIVFAEKAAWLGRKKTREEMRPARGIHRAAEYLDQVELDKAYPQSVVQNVGSRIIEVGTTRAFYTIKGELKPTVYASLRYTSDELKATKEFAEAD